MLGGFYQGSPSGELNWGRKRCSYPRVRGNGAASVTPASSSRPLLTQYKGRNWLNAKIVESCEGVRCRPARSSADVCQRGTVRQRMGGGNTPGGVSPHPQGARLTLQLVRQGDGLHYPVETLKTTIVSVIRRQKTTATRRTWMKRHLEKDAIVRDLLF